jgi:hypothetical protein
MGTEEITTAARRRRLVALVPAVLLAAAAGTSALVSGGGAASAATTTDLSVSQAFTGGTTSGQTVDTITIRNRGTATASNINVAMLIKTASTSTSVSAHNGGISELSPPPPGYKMLLNSQYASIPAGSHLTLPFTLGGTAGTAFTSFVSVGAASPGDPNLANNSNTKSSWYGPRADLRISSRVVAVTTAGQAKIVTTITNGGPNNANALQTIFEIKSSTFKTAGYSAVPLSSCQFIPPASGYNRAVSCVTNSLATGKSWVITSTYTGGKGASFTVNARVSANSPIDPVTTNNSNTRTTTYHS